MDALARRLPPHVHETLLNANIDSLRAILTRSSVQLQTITGLSSDTANEVLQVAVDVALRKKEFITADLVPPWYRLPTGCSNIDTITRGGIPLNGITELVGSSGVGKSQLCMQLALQSQLPGKERGVVYICTDDVFPSKRFHQLAELYQMKYNLPHADHEGNVFLEHTADYEQLRRCIAVRLPSLLNSKSIGLIVIDSIAGVFRSENSRVNYSKRSQQFVEIVTKLNALSDQHKLGIICVNQVTDNITTGKIEPCLGLAWSNLVTCRLKISRYNNSSTREFEVVFAPDLPCNVCQFLIKSEGIVDL